MEKDSRRTKQLIATLTLQLDSAATKLRKTTEALDSTRAALAFKDSISTAQADELEQLIQQLTNAEHQSKATERQRKTLAEKVALLMENNQKLRDDINDARANLKEQMQQYQQLTEQQNELKDQYTALQDRHDELQQQHNNLQQRYNLEHGARMNAEADLEQERQGIVVSNLLLNPYKDGYHSGKKDQFKKTRRAKQIRQLCVAFEVNRCLSTNESVQIIVRNNEHVVFEETLYQKTCNSYRFNHLFNIGSKPKDKLEKGKLVCEVIFGKDNRVVAASVIPLQ